MEHGNTQDYGIIKLMFDSIPYACHIWNHEYQMLDCNDASMKMFKVSSKEEFMSRFGDFAPEYQPDGMLSINKAVSNLRKAFNEGKSYFEFLHNDSEGGLIPCTITIVRVEGKYEQFVVAHVIDMREHDEMMKEIQHKDYLLFTVNNIAEILLQSPADKFIMNMHVCMSMIAEAINVDRVYIWKNYIEDGNLYCTQIHEWSENAESLQGNEEMTIGISYDDIAPGWEEILSNGGCVNSKIADMPSVTRKQLESQGVKSIFVAPVFQQDHFWGFIGFDDCRNERLFTENEESILRSTVFMLANSMFKMEIALELKDALDEARQASSAKSVFLSNMSHEIRTPMNAVIGMGELLMHEKLNERQSGYVHDIVISAKALLDIINDILDFSKIETGKMELNPVDFDLNSLIDNIESMFLYVMRKKGLEFMLERCENTPACLYGDDIRLRQVLTNILGNAVKFTDKGHVKLTIKTDDDLLLFLVEDTGIGISNADILDLFNPFEQVDKAKNRNVVGTGLGLSISKSFITAMSGDITVKSELGRGTVFTVAIPIVIGNPENITHSETGTNVVFSAPDARVLVVDDNAFNLKVASGLLGLMDIEAETAESGFAAIGLVQKNDYDIVFMDHMMPEMDGVETVRKIRALGGKYEKLTIVALTANAVKGAIEMFFNNGFNDFISKPIDADELRKVVKRNLPHGKIRETDSKSLESHSKIEDELFRKSIVTFVKDNRDTYRKITDALDADDDKTAHRIAHTLKSNAAYLKKTNLSEAAASLEASLSKKPPRHTDGQLLEIETELNKALAEFSKVLEETEAREPESVQLSAEELAGLFAELKPLLEKSDFGATEYAERLKGVEGLEKLAELIDEYDFHGALELLESTG